MERSSQLAAARPYEMGRSIDMRRERRRAMRQSAEFKTYRRVTRPFRRNFAGILTRREADRFLIATGRRQARLITEQVNKAMEAQT